MKSARQIARVVFHNPSLFLNLNFLSNFNEAKLYIEDEIVKHDRANWLPTDDGNRKIITDDLNEMTSWDDLFRKLCHHTLFSGNSPQYNEFIELWERIKGFDIDGLLEIGDTIGLRGIRKDSNFLAKHHLGQLAKQQWLTDIACLTDKHVHFGQFVESNLLWLIQLKSTGILLGNNYSSEATDTDFGALNRISQKKSVTTARPISEWQRRLTQCRLLLLIFQLSTGQTDALCEFFAACNDDNNLRDLHEKYRAKHQKFVKELDLVGIIHFERGVFSELVSDRPCTPEKKIIALAYTILKNSNFNHLFSNAINSFGDFSRSLKILDIIYDRVKNDVMDLESFGTFEKQLHKSSSHAAEVRLTLRPQKFRTNTFNREINRYRQMARYMSSDFVTLAVHRNDFESASDEDWKYLQTKVLEDHKEWGLKIVGIDLLGPEVRMDATSADRQPGGNSANLLLKSMDFVFEFRAKLAANLENEEIFATFHCGEYYENAGVGLLGMLAVLADNRFRPATDRISHGLILHKLWDNKTVAQQQSIGVIDAVIGKLLTQDSCWGNSLFSQEEQSGIENVLMQFQQNRNFQPFSKVCEVILSKVRNGHIKIEVCPFSNEMITQEKAVEHVWGPMYGRPNLMIGTDDPSLTQTLPWIEHLLLKSSHDRHIANQGGSTP